MNITDLRKGKRRSLRISLRDANTPDRRKGERRSAPAQEKEKPSKRTKYQRIWLTPGEKALLADLYLLLEKDKGKEN